MAAVCYTIAKVNLKQLLSDIRYQFDIAEAFGMDGLARLSEIERQQEDTAHFNCVQYP